MKDMKFEEAIARLESVVARLEEGSVSLDDALAGYEEGMALVRLCKERLNAAEARMMLVRDGENGAETVPFTEGDA